jgi:hypothetical protein
MDNRQQFTKKFKTKAVQLLKSSCSLSKNACATVAIS